MKLKFNSTLCAGCRTCEMVCAYHHFKVFNPKKAAIRITETKKSERKYEKNIKKGDVEIYRESFNLYQAKICNQCGKCIDVCPVDALAKKDGVVELDAEKCISCHTCVEVCPFDAIFIYDSEQPPVKCDLCGACVEECPTQALYISEE